MTPVATPFFFYLLSGLAVISGVLVITRRNAVHSALALIVTLLAVSGLYLMLYAPFVAGVQIIVYAGGIMVLFLFVIMLVNLERTVKERQFNRIWPAGVLAAVALLGLLTSVYLKGGTLLNDPATGKPRWPDAAVVLPDVSNTQKIGELLYGNYMFAFEIASLLLLVAILGAVIMAKKRI
jgi:NADH-quinone oxidoreductase subunit J